MLLAPERYGVLGAVGVIAVAVPLVTTLARWVQGVRILRAFVSRYGGARFILPLHRRSDIIA